MGEDDGDRKGESSQPFEVVYKAQISVKAVIFCVLRPTFLGARSFGQRKRRCKEKRDDENQGYVGDGSHRGGHRLEGRAACLPIQEAVHTDLRRRGRHKSTLSSLINRLTSVVGHL